LFQYPTVEAPFDGRQSALRILPAPVGDLAAGDDRPRQAVARGDCGSDIALSSKPAIIPASCTLSNYAEVARTIGIDIIAGHYREGAKLPGDAELIRLFGVSRPVLREAVKTLVAKGLLSTKAKVGTVVRERSAWNMFDADVLAWHLEGGIDSRFLFDLAEIRLAVEPRSAALAAQRRNKAHIAEMRRRMEQIRHEKSNPAGFAEGDLSLHIAIAEASGNPFMRSMGGVIQAALRASFLLLAPVSEDERNVTIDVHQRLVDAIASKDPEAASAAMVNVIGNGINRLRKLS
jgi:DNA-binding FadR family transcriptional regulator